MKPSPLYRDSRGRFVSLPPEARAKLEAMRGIPTLRRAVAPELNTLFVPERVPHRNPNWLERVLTWFTWNRSRA